MKECWNCDGRGIIKGRDESGYFWKECGLCDGFGILIQILNVAKKELCWRKVVSR